MSHSLKNERNTVLYYPPTQCCDLVSGSVTQKKEYYLSKRIRYGHIMCERIQEPVKARFKTKDAIHD